MSKLLKHLDSLLITAWVGSLWGIGYLAVPVLFYAQPDRQLAGLLAGQMFSLVSYLGIGCSIYLLLYRWITLGGATALRLSLFWVIAVMLVFTLIIQCGIQPVMSNLKTQALPLDVMHSAFSNHFKMLHGVSSIIYLIQSLLGIFLVVKTRQT